jgi:hypothetical protein
VSITRSSLRKRKSTTWRGNQSCLQAPQFGCELWGLALAGMLRLEIPLSDPVVPLSKTHVYVGSLRVSTRFNLCRPQASCADLRRLALSYRPAEDVGLLTLSQNLTMIRS